MTVAICKDIRMQKRDLVLKCGCSIEACLALTNKTQKGKSDNNTSKSHGMVLCFLTLSRCLTTSIMLVLQLMAILRSALGNMFVCLKETMCVCCLV